VTGLGNQRGTARTEEGDDMCRAVYGRNPTREDTDAPIRAPVG
jgi:hypothetical protein